MSDLVKRFTLYGKEIEVVGLDCNFYPHEDSCLVIVDFTEHKLKYSKAEINVALMEMLKTLNVTFKLAIDFFIVPLFHQKLSDAQLSFMDELKKETDMKYLVINQSVVKDKTYLGWDIVDLLPSKYVIGSDPNTLIIPV